MISSKTKQIMGLMSASEHLFSPECHTNVSKKKRKRSQYGVRPSVLQGRQIQIAEMGVPHTGPKVPISEWGAHARATVQCASAPVRQFTSSAAKKQACHFFFFFLFCTCETSFSIFSSFLAQ